MCSQEGQIWNTGRTILAAAESSRFLNIPAVTLNLFDSFTTELKIAKIVENSGLARGQFWKIVRGVLAAAEKADSPTISVVTFALYGFSS